VHSSCSFLDVGNPTVQDLSADLTTDIAPPELLRVLFQPWKDSKFPKASTFVLFFLYELHDFESSPVFSIMFFLLILSLPSNPRRILQLLPSAGYSHAHKWWYPS
jgi:hypothetical protein